MQVSFPRGSLVALLLWTLACAAVRPASAQDAPRLDGLVAYQTPSGAALQVDPRLAPGLDILSDLAVGRDLVDGLARRGVTVTFGAEPPRVWAHYDMAARRIVVDVSLASADPRTLAALLSHEAVHVRDAQADVEQARVRASAGACYAEEVEALRTELEVWLALFGPQGKAPAEHAYEREQNNALARYLDAPAQYWEHVTRVYARACGT